MFNQCVCVSLLFCMCLCSEVSSWGTGTSSAHLWSSSASCCSLITIEPLLCKQGSFCIMLSLVESLDYFDQQSGFFNFIIIISRLLLLTNIGRVKRQRPVWWPLGNRGSPPEIHALMHCHASIELWFELKSSSSTIHFMFILTPFLRIIHVHNEH